MPRTPQSSVTSVTPLFIQSLERPIIVIAFNHIQLDAFRHTHRLTWADIKEPILASEMHNVPPECELIVLPCAERNTFKAQMIDIYVKRGGRNIIRVPDELIGCQEHRHA
jgi:hypothetical protein